MRQDYLDAEDEQRSVIKTSHAKKPPRISIPNQAAGRNKVVNRRNTVQGPPPSGNLKNVRHVTQNHSGEEDRDIYTKSISKI